MPGFFCLPPDDDLFTVLGTDVAEADLINLGILRFPVPEPLDSELEPFLFYVCGDQHTCSSCHSSYQCRWYYIRRLNLNLLASREGVKSSQVGHGDRQSNFTIRVFPLKMLLITINIQ